MKWRKPPDALIALFQRATATLSNVEPRTMFGCPAAFANGHMFAGLFQDRLILRLPDAERTAFARVYGARPFEPTPGRVMREYVEVPAEVQANPRLLGASLVKGRDYAASLPPKVTARRSPVPGGAPARARKVAAVGSTSRRSTPASASSGRAGRRSSRR